MDRRQKLVLFASVVLFLAAMAVAVWFGGQKSPPGSVDAGQRFKAKPGTTRENAVVLSSNKRPSTEAGVQPHAPVNPRERLEVQSLSGTALATDLNAVVIQQALDAGSPLQGLAIIDRALAEAPEQDDSPVLQATRGILLSRMDASAWPDAEAAFEAGAAAAEDGQTFAWVLEQHAQALLGWDKLDQAEAILRQGLSDARITPDEGLRLMILLGTVCEMKQQPEPAASSYKQAVDVLLRRENAWSPDDADLARLASLRLSRLYRASGEEQAARALARRVQARLMPN
ncbi:MAG: hypothetical protein IT368_12005 [Candidatus Hydrogenedentes bacterium]|nr:hypothetical protein [Candidatus Hydrogenedentota bacterium]